MVVVASSSVECALLPSRAEALASRINAEPAAAFHSRASSRAQTVARPLMDVEAYSIVVAAYRHRPAAAAGLPVSVVALS